MPVKKADPMLVSMMRHYVIDRELSPQDLKGKVAEQAAEWANGRVESLDGGYTAADIAAARAELLKSATAQVDGAGRRSQKLRAMTSTQGMAPGAGGVSAKSSPAYNRFNTQPVEPAAAQALTGGKGQEAALEGLGKIMEHLFTAQMAAGRHVDGWDLVSCNDFLVGLLELVPRAQQLDSDALDAELEQLGAKAGEVIAAYREAPEDLELYRSAMAPRPRSAPLSTGVRNALQATLVQGRMLEIPPENVLKTDAGKKAFADFARDTAGQVEVDEATRDAYGDALNKAVPLQLRPMIWSRVELGETLAGEQIKGAKRGKQEALDGLSQVLDREWEVALGGARRLLDELKKPSLSDDAFARLGSVLAAAVERRGDMEAVGHRLQELADARGVTL